MKRPAKRPRATTAADRTFALVTPEGVDLRLKVAGYVERCSALALDGMIIVAILAGFTVIIGLAMFGAGKLGVEIGSWGLEVPAVIWMLGFFALRNFYFIFFELRPVAATPGKRIMRLRVATRSGGRLTADAVFARNALREIEIYLPLLLLFMRGHGPDGGLIALGVIWSGVFALFPLFNTYRLRLGDLAAGTMVIKTPEQRLRRDLTDVGLSADITFTDSQLDAYGIKELQVLEQVLRQNDRRALAEVSQRIRKKIGWNEPLGVADAAFLKAYYEALRGRLETRLLFGHRRVDKFDKP